MIIPTEFAFLQLQKLKLNFNEEEIFDCNQHVAYLKHRGWPEILFKTLWNKFQKDGRRAEYTHQQKKCSPNALASIGGSGMSRILHWDLMLYTFSLLIGIQPNMLSFLQRDSQRKTQFWWPVCIKWIIQKLLVIVEHIYQCLNEFLRGMASDWSTHVLGWGTLLLKIFGAQNDTAVVGIGSDILGFKLHIKRARDKRNLSTKSFSVALLTYRSGSHNICSGWLIVYWGEFVIMKLNLWNCTFLLVTSQRAILIRHLVYTE